MENLRSGPGMNILALPEGLQQHFILGEIGEDPQFDLRIVGRDDSPSLLRNEGLPNPVSFLGPDRDVLKVRVTGGEPAGGGHGLVIGGVNAARFRMNQFWEGIDIGGFEFGEISVTEDFQGKVMLERELC
jgi:hypothetical protein